MQSEPYWAGDMNVMPRSLVVMMYFRSGLRLSS